METPLEILLDIREKVGRIDERLDAVVVKVDDHELRLRTNEKWRWGVPGAGILAIVAGLIGFPIH